MNSLLMYPVDQIYVSSVIVFFAWLIAVSIGGKNSMPFTIISTALPEVNSAPVIGPIASANDISVGPYEIRIGSSRSRADVNQKYAPRTTITPPITLPQNQRRLRSGFLSGAACGDEDGVERRRRKVRIFSRRRAMGRRSGPIQRVSVPKLGMGCHFR